MMYYDDGIANEFENAHQKGLRRGFDLGWSYKGRFDRQLIQDTIDELKDKIPKDAYAINVLEKAIKMLVDHPSNRENISINSF
tara:strand:+ start:1190 stop:1438 length:249 start_codon:yes stop_codon:yes gene_type:complete